MAVKVYFESNVAAEAVAVFDDESTYDACYKGLEKLAKKNHWPFITESVVDEVELNDVFKWIDSAENFKHLSIEEEELLRPKESTYYLFGKEACQRLLNEGSKSLIRNKRVIMYSTFKFVEGVTRSRELVDAIDGWLESTTISEELYNKLQE
jgi:hypothetical protein